MKPNKPDKVPNNMEIIIKILIIRITLKLLQILLKQIITIKIQ